MKVQHIVTIVLLLVLSGCANGLIDRNGQDLMKSSSVVLKTNLHPDPIRSKLYTVNYLRSGLLPMCTPVELIELGGKRLVFKDKTSGIQYYYDRHRSTADLANYLLDYFGTSCDKEKVKTMSKIDQEGITKGKVLKGMSKDAVTLAVGFPPKHQTHSLVRNEWRYWINRWKTMVVKFNDQGKVSSIHY